jgi:hypothetical protein
VIWLLEDPGGIESLVGVVLWLLEDPGGIESIVGVREALAVRDLAVTHGVKLRVPLVHLKSGRRAPPLADDPWPGLK